MNVTKLKIKIKEVTEETRELTIEERCLNLVTVALVPGCSKECRAEASAKLNSIGFVANRGSQGKFRTETIRDATQEEIIAWYCIQSHIVCLTTDVATCRACPKNRGSNQCKMLEDYFESKKILKDKEIILELV